MFTAASQHDKGHQKKGCRRLFPHRRDVLLLLLGDAVGPSEHGDGPQRAHGVLRIRGRRRHGADDGERRVLADEALRKDAREEAGAVRHVDVGGGLRGAEAPGGCCVRLGRLQMAKHGENRIDGQGLHGPITKHWSEHGGWNE